MINLDQVRTLEWKVKQAVQLIVHLRRENDTLRGRLSDTEVRLQELESLLEAFKATQNEMESGIRSALEELDHLEGSAQESETQSGLVDQFAYPPLVAEVSAPEPAEAGFSASEEVLEDDGFSGSAAEEAVESVELETSSDGDFFEEQTVEEAIASDSGPVSVEPEVVEASDSIATEEELEDPAPVKAVQEDREPEQPGLGIF